MTRAKVFSLALVLSSLVSCATTHDNFGEQKVVFKTLLSPDHPLLKHSVLIFGERSGAFAFCNGVYTAKGTILTSGHCIFDEFRYWLFLPQKISAANPFTEVHLRAVAVTKATRHPQFKGEPTEGIVEQDIGVMAFSPAEKSILEPAPVAYDKAISLAKAKTLQWDEERAFFEAAPANTINISGFRTDRDQILKGVFETNDVASYIGRIQTTDALLISLNPGTSIHSGVSGSGLFTEQDGKYTLVGIVSHYVPSLNLLAGFDLTQKKNNVDAWLKAIPADKAPQK